MVVSSFVKEKYKTTSDITGNVLNGIYFKKIHAKIHCYIKTSAFKN